MELLRNVIDQALVLAADYGRADGRIEFLRKNFPHIPSAMAYADRIEAEQGVLRDKLERLAAKFDELLGPPTPPAAAAINPQGSQQKAAE